MNLSNFLTLSSIYIQLANKKSEYQIFSLDWMMKNMRLF